MRRKKQDVRGCGRGKERERKRNLQAGRLWIHDLNWLDPVAVFQAELEREKGWLSRKESRQRREQSQFCEERARSQTYSSGGLFPHAIHTASSTRRVESSRVESSRVAGRAVPCRVRSRDRARAKGRSGLVPGPRLGDTALYALPCRWELYAVN